VMRKDGEEVGRRYGYGGWGSVWGKRHGHGHGHGAKEMMERDVSEDGD
jgi:hypothetical protein